MVTARIIAVAANRLLAHGTHSRKACIQCLAGICRNLLVVLALGGPISDAIAQIDRPQTPATPYLIAIDPGHGGSDAGASGARSAALEKNLVLDLALQLGKVLQTEGNITVAFIRNSDVTLDLVRRTEIANYSQGTLLISLHAGASNNLNSHGARVFMIADKRQQDTASFAAPLNQLRTPLSASPVPRLPTLRLIPWERAHELYDAPSAALASALQSSLNMLYGTQYDICSEPLFLLKGAQMPAVLVEVGYLTHIEDDERLQKAEFQQELVNALKNGILDYLANSRRINPK
jgi:N-acetylmuramoyl-L-alanine amidase